MTAERTTALQVKAEHAAYLIRSIVRASIIDADGASERAGVIEAIDALDVALVALVAAERLAASSLP